MGADDAKRATRGARRGSLLFGLPRIGKELERFHGPPEPPVSSDPLELILFENVGYLARDEKRREAFLRLRKIGTRPEKILGADPSRLLEVTKAGILPGPQATKLRAIAERAQRIDLASIVKRGGREARRTLLGFPSLGKAGAERILLFSGAECLLALESNGLRVLLRVGWGREDKDYTKSLRSAQEALEDQVVGRDSGWLTRLHLLLRRHGQEVCRRSNPRCPECVLEAGCTFARGGGVSGSRRVP